MWDALKVIAETPVPLIFVVAGIVFLFLYLGGDLTAKVITSKIQRQRAGMLGVILMAIGIVLIVLADLKPDAPDKPREPLPGTLQFSDSVHQSDEDSGSFAISVTRINGSDGPASVGYATSVGTATDGEDFEANAGILTWEDNETTTKSFSVSILNDSADEPNETFYANLRNVTGAKLGSPSLTVLTIVDDDESQITDPSDNHEANCKAYATQAVRQFQINVDRNCGFGGLRWTAIYDGHYEWCLAASESDRDSETQKRDLALRECAQQSSEFLYDTNFPGGDIAGALAWQPRDCEKACVDNAKCVAWTWVKQGAIPSLERPGLIPFCALKGTQNLPKVKDACCVSGLKP